MDPKTPTDLTDFRNLVDPITFQWIAPAPDTPEFASLVQNLAERHAPHPFAIAAINEADRDAEIIAWGTEFPDMAQIFLPDGELIACCRNADSALHLLDARSTVPLRLLKLHRTDST